MATYLVTGGCGFIGSHLVDHLAGNGHKVRVLDNLTTGCIENIPRSVELLVEDILDDQALGRAMRGVDGCFHLAAVASVSACQLDPVGTHRVNLTGTMSVFDHARRLGPIPVIYASSAAVYGDTCAAAIREDAIPRPLSTYGTDKLACELHAAVMGRQYGVPIMGFRLFNIYGLRQNPSSPYSGVVSIFSDRIRRGQPLIIHGDGGQVRDFIHVSDVVRQLAAAIDRAESAHSVLNLCTGIPTSILDLARMMATIAGVVPQVSHEGPRQGDIRRSVGDPGLASERLGFRPLVSLSEGLRQIVQYRHCSTIPAAG